MQFQYSISPTPTLPLLGGHGWPLEKFPKDLDFFSIIFTSATKFIFGNTANEDDRKMSASEIEKISMEPPDFDIQNVSTGADFESHDEPPLTS